jgi:hypothetical protein
MKTFYPKIGPPIKAQINLAMGAALNIIEG